MVEDVSYDRAIPQSRTHLVDSFILHSGLGLFVHVLIFVNLDHDRVARSSFGIRCGRHVGRLADCLSICRVVEAAGLDNECFKELSRINQVP